MSTGRKQTVSSSAEPSDKATSGFSLLSAITNGFKAAGLAVTVWSWGYMGFSVAWIYVALFFHIVNEEYRKVKDSKKAFVQHALADEKAAILSLLDEYPSWVSIWQMWKWQCSGNFCFTVRRIGLCDLHPTEWVTFTFSKT